MQLNDMLLLEKNYTGPLYHITTAESAKNILLSQHFIFSNAMPKEDERKHIPKKGYKYFLSTARSLHSDYRTDSEFPVSMTLDTRYFTEKEFIIRPLDFFPDSKTYESEERIWSKKQKVSADCIREIHVFLPDLEENPSHRNITDRIKVINLLGIIKKTEKDYYIYNNYNSYIIHNKRQAIDFEITDNTFHNAIDKYKADFLKARLGMNIEGKELSHQDELEILQLVPEYIQYIKHPSEEQQLMAVEGESTVIQYINNPSDKVKFAAIQSNPFAIGNIDNPTEKMKETAVKQWRNAIKYIQSPSEKLQLMAVKKSYDAIRFIDEPTEKVQKYVIKLDGRAIYLINDPSEEIQMLAVKQDLYAFRSILNPTKKVEEYYQSEMRKKIEPDHYK